MVCKRRCHGEFKQYFPSYCNKCESNNFLLKSPIVEALQTVEIPPIKPIVTEHQAFACRYASCGKKVRSFLPYEVTTSVFGPKIKALSSTFSGKFHLSKRNIRHNVHRHISGALKKKEINGLDVDARF